MTGIQVHYVGSLRCSAVHLRSGNTLITDAPPDNNGKGEAFSPTDLLCTSLACCMITIMGITAVKRNIMLGDIHADVEKIMAAEPRRVAGIRITMRLENTGLGEEEKEILMGAARTCPVALSIHPGIRQEVDFKFLE